MFNVIDTASGLKADFIVRKARPFSAVELQRSREAAVLGTPVPVATAEDTILSKLEWSKAGESDRQYRDALGIAALRRGQLDWVYLERWAAELDVREELSRLRADAESLGTQ